MAANVQEWTVLSMLNWGTEFFKKKGLSDPRLSIEWLLAEVLQVKRLDLYLRYERPLSKQELNKLRPLIKRRAAHEPLQYITGYADFINTRLQVNSDVLIPRMETEQLAEMILDDCPPGREHSVLDIGTGSGCIAIALKMERPEWNVAALDISEKALEMAKKNAVDNETDITFYQHDILKPEKSASEIGFDIIVSNPPYVLPEEKEILEPQVVEHEPAAALFCEDIEMMYRRIIEFAESRLTENGLLYLEIHAQEKNSIIELFDKERWSVHPLKDYTNTVRFVKGTRHSPEQIH